MPSDKSCIDTSVREITEKTIKRMENRVLAPGATLTLPVVQGCDVLRPQIDLLVGNYG
jgi:hypothetical protein